jgi:hypothetical protein
LAANWGQICQKATDNKLQSLPLALRSKWQFVGALALSFGSRDAGEIGIKFGIDTL